MMWCGGLFFIDVFRLRQRHRHSGAQSLLRWFASRVGLHRGGGGSQRRRSDSQWWFFTVTTIGVLHQRQWWWFFDGGSGARRRARISDSFSNRSGWCFLVAGGCMVGLLASVMVECGPGFLAVVKLQRMCATHGGVSHQVQ